jgi:hypothetical protein
MTSFAKAAGFVGIFGLGPLVLVLATVTLNDGVREGKPVVTELSAKPSPTG